MRGLGLEAVQHPLRDGGLDIIAPGEARKRAQAVTLNGFREFMFPDLQAACEDLWAGAKLTTASNVLFFAAQNGRAIGASFAINAMLWALSSRRPIVLGKPSPWAFEWLIASTGIPPGLNGETLVVGDDPALQIRMANAVGATPIGVISGITDASAFDNLSARDIAALGLPAGTAPRALALKGGDGIRI